MKHWLQTLFTAATFLIFLIYIYIFFFGGGGHFLVNWLLVFFSVPVFFNYFILPVSLIQSDNTKKKKKKKQWELHFYVRKDVQHRSEHYATKFVEYGEEKVHCSRGHNLWESVCLYLQGPSYFLSILQCLWHFLVSACVLPRSTL